MTLCLKDVSRILKNTSSGIQVFKMYSKGLVLTQKLSSSSSLRSVMKVIFPEKQLVHNYNILLVMCSCRTLLTVICNHFIGPGLHTQQNKMRGCRGDRMDCSISDWGSQIF